MDGSSKGFDDSTAVAITGKITVIAIIVLFLVVVFVLFLHLYAKWFWWRNEEPPPPRRHRRRFVFAPGQETALSLRAAKGLDPTILASLPVLVFRQEEFKDGLECAVCLCELVEGEKARLLPKCNHGFHVDCIDMWFQSHSTCPLCRNPVSNAERESSGSTESVNDINANVHVESPHESLASTESPSFPTNVLFWGNETQVSSGAACLEEGASASASASSSSSSSSSSSLASGSSRQEGMLVIDIPTNTNDNLAEGELKSPMPTRLRSLKRLLSREKRVPPNRSTDGTSIDA